MQKIERHDITLRILFTFLTCGLYGLYWMAQVTNDVHAVSGKPQCAGGGKAVLFSVLTCSIYMYYWIYKIGGELVEARYRMGLALDVVEKKIYRNVIDRATGKVTDKQLIRDNHSEVMFDYDQIPKELIR